MSALGGRRTSKPKGFRCAACVSARGVLAAPDAHTSEAFPLGNCSHRTKLLAIGLSQLIAGHHQCCRSDIFQSSQVFRCLLDVRRSLLTSRRRATSFCNETPSGPQLQQPVEMSKGPCPIGVMTPLSCRRASQLFMVDQQFVDMWPRVWVLPASTFTGIQLALLSRQTANSPTC